MTTALLVVAFVLVTFNYNFPLLTKGYKGVSKHRFREWLFWAWGGRVTGGGALLSPLLLLEEPWTVHVYVALPLMFLCLLLINVFVTRLEIIRDHHKLMKLRAAEAYAKSDYYFESIGYIETESPYQPGLTRKLFLEGYREMRFEVTSRVSSALKVIDRACKNV